MLRRDSTYIYHIQTAHIYRDVFPFLRIAMASQESTLCSSTLAYEYLQMTVFGEQGFNETSWLGVCVYVLYFHDRVVITHGGQTLPF